MFDKKINPREILPQDFVFYYFESIWWRRSRNVNFLVIKKIRQIAAGRPKTEVRRDKIVTSAALKSTC